MQTPDLVKLFEQDADTVELGAGDTVFSQGDPGDIMYVVLSGHVKLAIDGHEFDTAKQGQIFGEMALIDTPERSATATTVEPTKLVKVDKRRFTFLVQEHPYFALYVMQVLAQRVRKIDRLVAA